MTPASAPTSDESVMLMFIGEFLPRPLQLNISAARTASPKVDTEGIVVDQLRIAHGHAIDSAYVEEFWTSIVGPTAVALLRLIARRAQEAGATVTLDITTTAEALGVSANGKNSRALRAMRRLVRYGIGCWLDNHEAAVAIYSHVPPVPLRIGNRWSPALTERHNKVVK